MSKWNTAKTLLGKLNHRGKAFWHEGNMRHLDRRMATFGDDAARANLDPKSLSRYNNLAQQRATIASKYQPHADEWARYTNSLTGGNRTMANIAGNITGGLYDMPRAVTMLPQSRMGIAAGLPAFAVADAVGLNPITHLGAGSYNVFGNPSADVEKGFRSGADDVVGSTVGMFNEMKYGDRRKFLRQGGIGGQYPNMMSRDAVGAFNGTGAVSGPGTFGTIMRANYTPDFYRRKALEKAQPHVQGYFNKTASAEYTFNKLASLGFLAKGRAMATKAVKALDPRAMGRSTPYTPTPVAPGAKAARGAAWRDKYTRYALPVGLGGTFATMAYGGAKQNAQEGGYMAGQDTALYGVQRGLQQMPAWQRELAAMFPGTASQMALQRYHDFTSGNHKANASGFGGKDGGRVRYGYQDANGEMVF